MKPVDVNPSMYIGFNEENNKEGPKFKVGDVRISNIKTFLQKAMFYIGLKKFLWLKKLKTLCREHVISDRKGEKIVGTFEGKELKIKPKSI